jgi:hypothetical protein
LLGFIGFQKSEELFFTDSGLFASSGIPKWVPLELMSVIFIAQGMNIIFETSDPNTYHSMEGSSENEETEELQFDLDDYEDEVPYHDHAEIQEEEEALGNEDLPQ